ncbi:hypothetical protein JIN77_16215 [Verrucomicrobiaceae bacterium R5-34]|nr:hypothetical protein [Verrucomicrobiaceae bacterium R5-34]
MHGHHRIKNTLQLLSSILKNKAEPPSQQPLPAFQDLYH